MATAIYLPKVGMTMEEATLTKWVEADGAEVSRGQVIFEMETEKVQMEIEAEAAGRLKHLVPEGAELRPGDVVGCLLAAGEEVPQDLLDRVVAQSGAIPSASQSVAAAAEATAPDAPHSAAEVTQPEHAGMLRVSPVARRLADEYGIDVRTLTGSGPDGRIVERDVQRAIEARGAPSATPQLVPTPAEAAGPRVSPVTRRLADEHGIDVRTLTGSGPDGRIVERDVRAAIEAGGPEPGAPHAGTGVSPAPTPGGPGAGAPSPAEAVPYSGRRRVIGERMFQSLSGMAQLTLVSETPVDEATKMLHGLNREWRRDNVVVTLTALVVKACALALREHPHLNARLDAANGNIVLEPEVNVGVAVAQDAGLIVPVVRNADGLPLKEVAAALQSQLQKARADRLTVEDVEGGTFTVTSLEGTGVDAFTPIVNPPQAAILGVGRVRDVAAFEGSELVKRQVTTLSLTFDHRVTDGHPAARFLDRVAELLGRPYLLM